MLYEKFLGFFENVLHFVAETTVYTLELIGILIIIIGSVKTIIRVIRGLKNNKAPNIVIALGRTLALALEFKMGAEIVNTVIIRDLKELGVLAVIICLRAILAILIHWEIKNEKAEEDSKKEE